MGAGKMMQVRQWGHSRRVVRVLGRIVFLGLWACQSGLQLPPAAFPRVPLEAIWPDVGAVVLEDVANLNYQLAAGGTGRVEVVLDHRRRIQVLTPAGLAAAEVILTEDGFSSITRLVGRSVDPNMRAVEVGADAVAVTAEVVGAPELRRLRLQIPGAVVGGLLEYRYQRIYRDAALVPPWVFGGLLPVLHAELGVQADVGIRLDYRYGIGEASLERSPVHRRDESGRDRLVFLEQDLPAYYPAPMMPDVSRQSPWLLVALRGARTATGSQRYDGWETAALPVWQQMQAVGAKARTGEARSIYHEIQAALRPLPQPGLGVRTPQSARALGHGTPACSRDAAGMLAQALADVPGAAAPALLPGPQGARVLEDFAGLYPFTRALVALTDPAPFVPRSCTGQPFEQDVLCGLSAADILLLDPSCGTCGFGVLPFGSDSARVLVLDPNGGRWLPRPEVLPERHVLAHRGQLDMDVTGHLLGTAQLTARGAVAAAVRAVWPTSPPAGGAARLTGDGSPTVSLVAGRASLAHFGAPTALGPLRAEGLSELDAPLQLFGQLSLQADRLDYEHYRLLPVDLAGSSIPEPWLQSRRWPALLDGPRWLESTVEVRLPLGYRAAVAPAVTWVNDYAEYAAGFSQHGRILRYARRLVLKRAQVPAAAWPAFLAFVQEIRALEQQGVAVQGSP